MELQAQLEGTENRINVARTNFNNAAKNFNTAIRRFPKKYPCRSLRFLRNELISKRQKERNKLPRYNSDNTQLYSEAQKARNFVPRFVL